MTSVKKTMISMILVGQAAGGAVQVDLRMMSGCALSLLRRKFVGLGW